MDNSFLAYIQQLELIAFFSGYPLIYTVIIFMVDRSWLKNTFFSRITQLLPLAYALVGTLFLAFELKKLYPDYSIGHIEHIIQQPYLVVWGVFSILFWMPVFRKLKIWSLVHGLIFFLLIIKDIFFQFAIPSADNSIVKNDMKVYWASLVLNLGAIMVIGLISFAYTRSKKYSVQ